MSADRRIGHTRNAEQRQRSGWKGYRIIKRRVRADEDLARHKDRIRRRGVRRPLALHRHESYEDLTITGAFCFTGISVAGNFKLQM